jgi:hypothetical protein
VRLVVQVKLLPTPEQSAALQATLRAANQAADLVSRIAFQQRCFRNFDLRKHTYEQVKAVFGLAAQPAQHVIKKVCDAYRTLHANLAAGHLGKPGNRLTRCGGLGSESRCLTRTRPSTPSTARSCKLGRLRFTAEKLTVMTVSRPRSAARDDQTGVGVMVQLADGGAAEELGT